MDCRKFFFMGGWFMVGDDSRNEIRKNNKAVF